MRVAAKHIRLVLLTCCLLLVPAAVALASWSSGGYSGKFSNGSKITFRGAAHSIKNLATTFVKMPCSDGTSISIRATGFGKFASVPLTSKGKFKAVSTSGHITIAGQLHNNKAAGTARYVAHLNAQRQYQDPDGPIACDSGLLTWSAKHPTH
jgi:hypothetical protein